MSGRSWCHFSQTTQRLKAVQAPVRRHTKSAATASPSFSYVSLRKLSSPQLRMQHPRLQVVGSAPPVAPEAGEDGDGQSPHEGSTRAARQKARKVKRRAARRAQVSRLLYIPFDVCLELQLELLQHEFVQL